MTEVARHAGRGLGPDFEYGASGHYGRAFAWECLYLPRMCLYAGLAVASKQGALSLGRRRVLMLDGQAQHHDAMRIRSWDMELVLLVPGLVNRVSLG